MLSKIRPFYLPHLRFRLRRYHCLVITALLLGGQGWFYLRPGAAASPAPGTVIENQATGSYVDNADASTETVQSEVVKMTVAEVSGIVVTAQGTSGTFHSGDISYFDFTITNVGNDPTQFFIPDGPSEIVGGTQQGNIQIISYDADGGGSGAAVNLTSNNIYVTTAGGATTGNLLNGVTGTNDGSLPPGGTVTIRIPINVTGAVGSNVSVTLGDTPVPPNATSQNQAFVLGTKDVYTVDNSDTSTVIGEATGSPVNGDSVNHWQEASAKLSAPIVAPPIALSGKVFEDVNYGGGAGRNLTTAAGIVRSNVRVELYNASGAFQGFTTTDALGAYTFDSINITGGISAGDYTVRVVNSTVTSSRPNPLNATGLLPVQTFRTDASTGTAIDDPNRVGGEIPAEVDAPANTGSQTLATINIGTNEAESIAPVKVVSSNVTGIDFGFNFDTIVNTNDSGQGSLRQFILNSNALSNTGLAQALPSSITAPIARSGSAVNLTQYETSIFMIPDPGNDNRVTAGTGVGKINLATTAPDGGTGKAFEIDLTSAALDITDPFTSIDGRTQAVNIPSISNGSNLTVNLASKSESTGPVIVLKLIANVNDAVIDTQASNTIFHSIGVTGSTSTLFPGIRMSASGGNTATTTKISNFIVENVTVFGVTGCGVYPVYADNAVIRDSVIRDNGSDLVDLCDNIQLQRGSSNALIENNLLLRAGHYGIDIPLTNNDTATGQSSNNNIIRGNIIAGNGVKNNGGQTAGIGIRTSIGTLIEKNKIYSNRGDGIVVTGVTIPTSNKITISQNSIYSNGELGIDLGAGAAGDGVSANDGAINAARQNNGLDYPIITSSNLSSGTLTVSGYVGNNPAGSATFQNLTLEFFIAADDGNNNGAVIVGDGKNLPHGEGKTYIGGSTAGNLCTTNATGFFNCTFPNAGTVGLTSASNITATATDSAGNTSEFSSIPSVSTANVLLVKRITAINGSTTTVNGDDLAIYKDTSSPYDDNVKENPPFIGQPNPNQTDTTFWPNPASFLLGGTNGGNIRPSYEMDYTIYFLSTGNTSARSTELCDRIPPNQDFVHTAFNGATAASGGIISGNRGILVSIGGVETGHTNLSDGDMARYYEPGEVLPTSCGTGVNTNGAILVNLGILPAATAPGIPANSHGFVRFRVKMR